MSKKTKAERLRRRREERESQLVLRKSMKGQTGHFGEEDAFPHKFRPGRASGSASGKNFHDSYHPLRERRKGKKEGIRLKGSLTDVTMHEELTRVSHDITDTFPDAVTAEAASMSRVRAPLPECTGSARTFTTGAGRFDLRTLPFVTIDGEDARDFDDAICVELIDGQPVLWVAIADVSLHVRAGSAIDREAARRGNSFYFPASVTPMLPEILCNDLCSLRPQADRAVVAVRLACTTEGKIIKTDFAQAVICSSARLTYTTVQAHFDGNSLLPAPVGPMLDTARALAASMIRNRHEAGGLFLEIPEPVFTIKKNRVVSVQSRPHLFANDLIEAFMVAANEAVSAFLTKHTSPFPQRIHPAPAQEKLEALLKLVRSSVLGASMPQGDASDPQACIAAILSASSEANRLTQASRLILRAMMQACYIPGPVTGTAALHYGLASDSYCHFTSPIRRYADLVVHRALKRALRVPDADPAMSERHLASCCEHCNEADRASQDAEREIHKRLICLLLQNHIGEEFDAVVTGITDFGFFAEPSGYPADGLVRLADMADDWYTPDAMGQKLVGSRTGRSITIGDSIRLRLTSVSVGRLEIDFMPADAHRDMRRQPRGAFRSGHRKNAAQSAHDRKRAPARRPAETTRPRQHHPRHSAR